MRSRPFIQCDVFTDTPTRGNGLAVVMDGTGLSDAEMQAFAAWTNLAETTFLLPARSDEADYTLRIFTPTREMPFAGHPTLGSCAAWLHLGGQPKEPGIVRQDCGVGVVEIDLTGPVPAFVAPATAIRPMDPDMRAAILSTLDIPEDRVRHTAELDNGPVWQMIELASAEDVLRAEAMRVRWPEFKAIGLFGAYPDGADCAYEVRMLAPSSGMAEDPITGSLNAAIALWLQNEGRLTGPLTASQGQKIGRKGRVHILPHPSHDGRVLIGGETQMLIEGTVRI
ncbi:PhzF family phenazine biosynthesis protein [Rubricella aquisinus]|uniref:PhzF family phenazine biosynthesis protein n=1 Tax=Rubricella aquisinus TaxID=2028108 RepID=A0A840WNQ5_9RHOB|nr:PhzF family phenazine biosynthesis protein [Rubricella aquisinus]MBB5516251.1 PhzF family phenazine biosynthesis protein [Rubricella aquisinus]